MKKYDDEFHLNCVKFSMFEGMGMKILVLCKLKGQDILKSQMKDFCNFVLEEIEK